jgi:hypothetical protein
LIDIFLSIERSQLSMRPAGMTGSKAYYHASGSLPAAGISTAESRFAYALA